MKNYYKAKLLQPTATKGLRVKLTLIDTDLSWIEPYNYKFNSLKDNAIHMLTSSNLKRDEIKITFFDGPVLYIVTDKNYSLTPNN
jgi:hypothetical protein